MSTHDGYIEWFPWLRIDCFTNQPNPATGKMPLVYLLTHAHSDHLAGLDRASFSGKIYLHPLTKELVLNWIEAPERVRYTELGVATSESASASGSGGALLRKPAYRYKNLTKRPAVARNAQRGSRSRVSVADQMVDVAYNQPFQLEGPNGTTVDVTPIDANHCPGSCMFLIEGRVENRLRTVLVTGDIRIDCDYLETLRRNPLLAPYVAYSPFSASSSIPTGSRSKGERHVNNSHNRGESGLDEDSEEQRPAKRKKVAAATTTKKPSTVAVKILDRIYLDTSQVQLDEKLVSKERAVADLVRLIELYPPNTQFFLNAWTLGYEEMLKGVCRAFGERIHLDWYKARQYTCPAMRATDPLLASLGHCDPHPSVVNYATTTATSSNSAQAGTSKTKGPDHKPFVGRFHACERRWKCDQVWQGGVGCYEWDEEYLDQIGQGSKKLVRPTTPSADASIPPVDGGSSTNLAAESNPLIVNVNPAEMPEWCWDEYRPQKEKEIRDWIESSRQGRAAVRVGGGVAGPSRNRDKELSNEEGLVPPNSLVVPLARHSSRPELQDFVALFRPRTVYPLTCTNPELFKLLPVIFDERHLAPGGVEQQRAEIARHTAAWFDKAGVRKRLTAMLNSGLFAAAYGFPPRAQTRTDVDDDEEGGGEEEAAGLKMSKTMAVALAKGLNVEGDDRIIEEHLKWLKKATERHGTATVSPQRQPVGVIVLSDSEDNDDDNDKRRGGDAGQVCAGLARPTHSMRRHSSRSGAHQAVQAAPAAPRQLEFASLSSDASRRLSKLGTGLLPPYSNRMPSPFLAAADDVMDEDLLPHDSTSVDENRKDGLRSPLRLSDAPKPSRATTASASDSHGGGSSSTTVDSEGVIGRRERRQVVPTPELWPPPPPPRREIMSAPRLPSTVLSDSTDILNVKAADARRGAASSPSCSRPPPVPRPTSSSDAFPPANKRSKGKEKQKARSTSHLRLEATMSEADAETVAAFYRIQRGKIGPGKIVYFDAGDPRLQGRSSVKAVKAAKAAAKAERNRQRKKASMGAMIISPKSFRTVSASVSISPRA